MNFNIFYSLFISLPPIHMQLTPWKNRQTSQPATLHDAVSRIFEDSFLDPFSFFNDRSLMPAVSDSYVPAFDISETDKELRIVADVPGYDPAKIDVEIDGNMLTIRGSMEESQEEKDKQWIIKRSASGNFVQRLQLPQNIDDKHIKCKAKNGKLSIFVPKTKDTSKSGRKLSVETA
jgi:HSP20 family protein